jgi:hypothetical protein
MELFNDYRLMTVTPEMAQQWLDQQPINRGHKQPASRHYVDLMRQGRWIASPALALLFDTSGFLRDGQNRCLAVIAHGKPVEMFGRFNVPEEELIAIHDTVPRTLADQVVIQRQIGPDIAKYVASIGSVVAMRLRGPITLLKNRTERMNVTDLANAYDSIGVDGLDVARRARALYESVPNGLRLFSVTEIGYALAQNPAGIEQWLERLVSDGGGKTASMLAARTYQANEGGRSRTRNGGHMAIAKAWNSPNVSKIQAGRRTETSVPRVPDLSGGCFDPIESKEAA